MPEKSLDRVVSLLVEKRVARFTGSVRLDFREGGLRAVHDLKHPKRPGLVIRPEEPRKPVGGTGC